MIDNLDLLNINEDTLNKINELEYDMKLSLAVNYENINTNLDLFRSIGINEDLLLYRPEALLMDPKELRIKIAKLDISALRKDYSLIEELFN